MKLQLVCNEKYVQIESCTNGNIRMYLHRLSYIAIKKRAALLAIIALSCELFLEWIYLSVVEGA